jgi:hypothetical protein
LQVQGDKSRPNFRQSPTCGKIDRRAVPSLIAQIDRRFAERSKEALHLAVHMTAKVESQKTMRAATLHSTVTKGHCCMARFAFNLSQTVRYNVYVEAPTRMDALHKLVRDLQEPDGKPIDLYEVDNDGLTIDAGQMDVSSDLRRVSRG